MKVALALPYVRPGFGIEHRTLRLAEGLPPAVERVLLCVRQEVPVGPPIRGFPGPASRFVMRGGNTALGRAVLEHRFRAWLGSDWIVDAQYAPMTALRPRGPFVVTWYSVPPLQYATSLRERQVWSRDRDAMLAGARRADLVLCISEALADEVQRELGTRVRTEVLMIGCDPPAAAPTLPREGRRILSIGRFAPHKCHEDTLAAVAALRRRLPRRDVQLVVCGTAPPRSPYLSSLQDRAVSLGLEPGRSVRFLPNATSAEIRELLASSDVFVSASRWEGFGMPLIEAQSAGLPAVAYRLWSHPEVVAAPDHLVREGDVEALAGAMAELLEDETRWRKASEQARLFASGRFGWQGVIDRYVDLLGGL